MVSLPCLTLRHVATDKWRDLTVWQLLHSPLRNCWNSVTPTLDPICIQHCAFRAMCPGIKEKNLEFLQVTYSWRKYTVEGDVPSGNSRKPVFIVHGVYPSSRVHTNTHRRTGYTCTSDDKEIHRFYHESRNWPAFNCRDEDIGLSVTINVHIIFLCNSKESQINICFWHHITQT